MRPFLDIITRTSDDVLTQECLKKFLQVQQVMLLGSSIKLLQLEHATITGGYIIVDKKYTAI